MSMKPKCVKCSDPAVIHITEVDEQKNVKEIHVCYKHAQDYLQEAEEQTTASMGVSGGSPVPVESVSTAACPICKITYAEFRSSGRLGCPHDYEAFKTELRSLLEGIHGGLRHIGKVPRSLPADAQRQTQLIRLRQEMQAAIAVEDYERAAKLRDEIESLEKPAPT